MNEQPFKPRIYNEAIDELRKKCQSRGGIFLVFDRIGNVPLGEYRLVACIKKGKVLFAGFTKADIKKVKEKLKELIEKKKEEKKKEKTEEKKKETKKEVNQKKEKTQ